LASKPKTMIAAQIKLMKSAIKTMDDIETVRSLIEPIDPITCKVLIIDLQNKYIDITTQLLSNFLKTSNEL